jgi:hypothetical protein
MGRSDMDVRAFTRSYDALGASALPYPLGLSTAPPASAQSLKPPRL